ncbi:hypothetical protein V6N11_026212 [Hibiscus sabdariffa]|uniref:Uncharacterized protein n=1 Tax=Hibiscus sabdariffa TaxID=183260 RepID=A0ABR2SVR8_9ROSI
MIFNSGNVLPSFHYHSKKNYELSKGKSNDFDNPTKVVLEVDSTEGWLETPQDKTPIFETCAVLDSLMVAKKVDPGAVQVFDERFKRKGEDPTATKHIFKLVEDDDPFKFRLLLMEKAAKASF